MRRASLMSHQMSISSMSSTFKFNVRFNASTVPQYFCKIFRIYYSPHLSLLFLSNFLFPHCSHIALYALFRALHK